MSIKKELIAEYNGKKIYSFFLSNGKGLSAEILNYGGIIKRLIYNKIDVCLGFDTFEDYLTNDDYFGAIIGRNANRIVNSEFTINGKEYKLTSNSGKDNHHGGINGFDKKIWEAELIEDEETSLILRTTSEDGEEGFPGNLTVKVTYTLTKDNSIKIHYEAESDADTVVNLTNHTYFNLNGHESGSILNHSLCLCSDFYTPNGDNGATNGEILSVKGTVFDFNEEASIKNRIESTDKQIISSFGIDHNFILKGAEYRKVGFVKGDKSGIAMEIYTDRDGMQVYTANEILGNRVCKDKVLYTKHNSICLETQAFPGNLKYSHFPSSILKKGEKFNSVTSYKFI